MIQGDETCEQSSESASSDPLDSIHLPLRSHNSDDGDESPIHSHYSSFRDSEFERYCSANSVMGTPSSVGDREFGLLGGSGLGDISSSFENFRLEGEFAKTFRERLSSASRSIGFSSHKINQGVVGNDGFRTCDEFNSANSMAVPVKDWSEPELPTIVDLSTLVDEELCIDDDFGGIVRCRDCSHLGSLQSSVGTLPVQQTINGDSAAVNVPGVENDIHQVESHLDELHSHSDVGFEREEGERFLNEDEDLSGFEHSDGEDSMSGYATDGDLKLEFSNQENMHCYQEPKIGKGNGLLLSSSVAFGSDDWDNFIHENGPSDVTSIMLQKRGLSFENEKEAISLAQTASDSPVGGSDKGEVMDVSVSSNQAKGACQLRERSKNTYSTLVDCVDSVERKHGNDAEDICIAKNETVDLDELTNYHENHICSDVSSVEHKSLSQRLPFEEGLNASGALLGERIRLLSTRDSKDIDGKQVSESQESDNTILHLDPILDAPANQCHSVSTKRNGNPRVAFFGEALLPVMIDKHYDNRPMPDSPASLNLFQSHQKTVKTDNIELHDHCDELVHEMEEVLLHSIECLGTRFTDCDRPCQGRSPLPLGDGGSTASTSGTDDAYPLNQPPVRINGIEVIGAKQRKGDVSFGERLVGVKEYTVYVIRVWNGEDHWEVKRRYRDFCTLHRRLKSLFTAQGWVLPPPWSLVERESRKIFGNVSPDVVAKRSALIQECLQSILSHQFPSSLPSALIWFLSPQKNFPSSLLHNAHDPQSPFLGRDTVMTFGKTIALIVEIHPYKSIKQILEDQHFTCAACHKHFDDGKNRMLEFVQTLGWGKPRLCEYTGQLFCSSCHTNDIAVLPARVLHHWDFTQFLVSQMAKSYLDSIHDKPMLCVSAVNPFLFSKVPALQQVTVVRKRIALMLPFVRCPFRMSIFKGLSSRRYLLESNDFFALRDLIDLSKGAFAALPVMVDTVCKKIQEHITEQCLVCCDVGIPCNARQACKDPSALIFPFQEGEIERCRSCKSVFHMPCFKKILNCPCGESLKLEQDRGGPCHGATSESNGTTLDLFGRKSDPKPTLGFFSGLFSKAKHGKLLGPKDGDTTVISMGSLPSTSLR